MRKKIATLVAVASVLQGALFAHPGHGAAALQSSVWHWMLEPVHMGLTLALVAAAAGSAAIWRYRRRSS